MRFSRWATAASWAVLAACASCPAQPSSPAVPLPIPAPVPGHVVDQAARGIIVFVPRPHATESSVRGTHVVPIRRRGDLFELTPPEPTPAPRYIDPPLQRKWRLESQPKILPMPQDPRAWPRRHDVPRVPGSDSQWPGSQTDQLYLTRPGSHFLAPAPERDGSVR